MIEEILGWNISREAIVFIISILPVVELRGALPIAINVFHIPWYKALCLAIAGNLLPVPILLLFLSSLVRMASRVKLGQNIANWIFERARRRSSNIVKYERIGLMLFVAVPLPVTGAWTGSIAAFLLGFKFKYAFLSIFSGIVIAGVIVTCLCLLGWVGAVVAGLVMSTLAVVWWKKRWDA